MEAKSQTMGPELGSLSVYIHRVLECILQARGSPSSEPKWVKIQAALVDVPSSLRGTGSFTRLLMHNSPILAPVLPKTLPHSSITIHQIEE